MNSRFVSFGIAALSVAFANQIAQAQTQRLPDTAENHWAYVAVKDLANKGLVKGYKDAKFLDGQLMTNFEFASVVSRVMEKVDDLAVEAHAKGAVKLPFGEDTLNEIQALTVKFSVQLADMQADVKKSQDDIDALRADVDDAKDIANRARQAADNSYGFGPNRKFAISGYIQTRFVSAGSKDTTKFPNGAAASSSAYNGNYMQGGAPESFVLRRSRVKFTGAVTPNTKYAVQIDASGLTNGSNQAVTVREGNISYTPGDGSPRNPTFTTGLFANPFGYILPLSSASIPTPERPLAFNEGSAGIFASQDYDRGLQVAYAPGMMKYLVAFVNGSGVGTNDTDRNIDQIYRLAYTSPNKQLGAGLSYYNGHISYVASPAPTRKKELFGVDAQYTSPKGPFLLAEYMGGTFEQTTYFDQPTLKLVTANAPGNKIDGYYLTAGYNIDPKGAHPWSVAVNYDLLRRSASGFTDSGSSWDDKNFGFGVTYNLDAASRLKLWYLTPSAVAHPSAQPDPKKISLITGELQVKF